jgi:hypothetical protein
VPEIVRQAGKSWQAGTAGRAGNGLDAEGACYNAQGIFEEGGKKLRRRVPLLLLFTALALGISGVAAACGGGEEGLSVEEYFQQLQTISDEFEERGATLDSEFEAAFGSGTSDEVDVDAIQRILGEGATSFKDALNDAESLEPPSNVENAHREFVEEMRVRADLIESLADRAGEVESASDLEEVFAEFESPELETQAVRFSDACRALEGLAADNGIQADLNCE